jgi:hypothetical protein
MAFGANFPLPVLQKLKPSVWDSTRIATQIDNLATSNKLLIPPPSIRHLISCGAALDWGIVATGHAEWIGCEEEAKSWGAAALHAMFLLGFRGGRPAAAWPGWQAIERIRRWGFADSPFRLGPRGHWWVGYFATQVGLGRCFSGTVHTTSSIFQDPYSIVSHIWVLALHEKKS